MNEPRPDDENTDYSDLERIAEGVLEDDGAPAPKAALARILLSERYRGSFAHPDVLRGLGEVVKDGAERGFKLTEREQEHRHKLDEKLVNSEVESRKRLAEDRRLLIVLTFVFMILALVGAFVALLTGHPAGAGLAGGAVVIIGGLAALVWRSRDGKTPPGALGR